MKIPINLNENIKVKFTDLGEDIYYHRFDNMNTAYKRDIIEPSYPIADERGYSTLQLWYFMRLYGDYIDVGEPNVIEDNNIIYEKVDLGTREKVSDLLEKLYFNSGTNLNMTGVLANRYYCEEIWKALYGDDAEVPAWMRLWKGGPEE